MTKTYLDVVEVSSPSFLKASVVYCDPNNFIIVHRSMQFPHLCLRTQTMTSLLPQAQNPSRKSPARTTRCRTLSSLSGFMMCPLGPATKAHNKVPMILCPPVQSAGSSMIRFQHVLCPLKETVRHPHFTTYQNPVLLTSQVHPNCYRESTPHRSNLKTSSYTQFHQMKTL